MLALFAVAAPLGAVAADDPLKPEEGPWRIVLKTQLKAEQSCDLNEVLGYQEVPLGGDVGLDGRASCLDGREFNFTRKGKDQKFSLDLCKPAVC
ncbi:hypothetical protein [Hyphomicrobium sp.]|uniref:hypothetical protein n=1 Tax=Hyphomicrobium sp. TaxID=82 RepID=UPI002E301A5A|nr:hypothetical protein [Hyphomicrobium sp.]HEX2842538.1 hypothetical protein [Hyphomicrobium sp.]